MNATDLASLPRTFAERSLSHSASLTTSFSHPSVVDMAGAPSSNSPSPPHTTNDVTRSRVTPPPARTVDSPHHDYNFSPRAYDESSASEAQDVSTDEEMARLNAETVSSRSSISSLPMSLAPNPIGLPQDAITPIKSPADRDACLGMLSSEGKGRKWRDSPFRHPSSVRNMQMRDEDDMSLDHTRRTPRTTRNMSTFSARSSGSASPSKRRSGRDGRLSSASAKVKREFPLVLLHCSLLPPAMPIQARVSDAALLQAVLPDEYWRRWELLTDKITHDLEVQSRGVLIPHPKSDYELLEERLLESLELAGPRLRSGHFYGNENVSDIEESESDSGTAIQGAKCQDCGKRVRQDFASDRKWEVKVYAANGLMRAGAWAAAWNEMEKVDVEVGVWLPEDVRREVEERYISLGIEPDIEADPVHEQEPTEAEIRRREIYGSPGRRSQEEIDGLFEASHPYHQDEHNQEQFAQRRPEQHQDPRASTTELKGFLFKHIKILAQDKRNLAIALLSLVVLLFAGRMAAPWQRAETHEVVSTNVSAPLIPNVVKCTTDELSRVPEVRSTTSLETQSGPVTLTDNSIGIGSVVARPLESQSSIPELKQDVVDSGTQKSTSA